MNTKALPTTIIGTLIPAVLLLAGRDATDEDWRAALRRDSLQSYQQFLAAHPDSEHAAANARQRIATLERQQDFAKAQEANSVAALENYLPDHPNAPNAARVHKQIADLQRGKAWRAARGSQGAGALPDFTAEYPDTPEATLGRDELAGLSAHSQPAAAPSAPGLSAGQPDEPRVAKLATLKEPAAARRAATQFETEYADVPGPVGLELTEADRDSKFHRVRAAALPERAAEQLCADLAADGQDCRVLRRRPQPAPLADEDVTAFRRRLAAAVSSRWL